MLAKALSEQLSHRREKVFCLRQLFVPLLLSLSAATRAAGTSAVLAPTDTTIHYREPAPLPLQYRQVFL